MNTLSPFHIHNIRFCPHYTKGLLTCFILRYIYLNYHDMRCMHYVYRPLFFPFRRTENILPLRYVSSKNFTIPFHVLRF